MTFKCDKDGCENTQQVLQQIPDAAIEALEEDYGWSFMTNGQLWCHQCAMH